MKIRGLYAIADSRFNPYATLAELAHACLDGGASVVQLRMKDAADVRTVLEEGRAIMRLKQRFGFIFIVNDYVDAAIELGADGVHVGSNDAPVAELKSRLPSGMIVGFSSHAIDEAVVAQAAGADYIAFGAIFPTRTKGPGHPVQGVGALGQLVKAVSVPVVAIGGIGRDNIDRVIEAHPAAVAMITALSGAHHVADEARWFAEKLRFAI